MVEWVEVEGPNVEKAIQAALTELGLASVEEADVEIIREGQRGFLGMGGADALVRVKRKEESTNRRRRGRGGRRSEEPASGGPKRPDSPRRDGGSERRPSAEPRAKERAPRADREKTEQRRAKEAPVRTPSTDDDREDISIEEQQAVITTFLEGLLTAFGLEGAVTGRVEDEAIYVDVTGEQTEALVGPKGGHIQATLELCRTVVQRRTMSGAKIRLDIAGYSERRREALRIYAARLAERIVAEGGEVMLEPMNSADRKVVHDTIAEIEGVRSFSEGEEPRRSVVIAAE